MQKIVECFIKRNNKLFQTADVKSVEDVIKVSENFLEVFKLSFELKNLPFKKKKNMVKKMEARMDDLFQNAANPQTNITFDNILILAIAYFNMGSIYANCADIKKLYIGKGYFIRCFKLLQGKESNPKTILIALTVLIELRNIWVQLNKQTKCNLTEQLLPEKTLELYIKYTKEKNECPINVPNILGIKKELNFQQSLDKLHLITVEVLENIYNQYNPNNMYPNNMHKFVMYMHNILKGILPTLQFQDIECHYWALTSNNLSTYFLSNHRFTEARHHLAAADYIMNLYEEKLLTIDEGTYLESKYAVFDKFRAHSARSWGFYGITLLCLSEEKLYQKNKKSCETDNSNLESLMHPKKKLINSLLFADLENNLESITNQITDTCVSNFNDAKAIVGNVLKWYNTAKSYFTLEEDTLSYANIMIEISNAYKYLINFEQSTINQMKICKLGEKTLENLIKDLDAKGDT